MIPLYTAVYYATTIARYCGMGSAYATDQHSDEHQHEKPGGHTIAKLTGLLSVIHSAYILPDILPYLLMQYRWSVSGSQHGAYRIGTRMYKRLHDRMIYVMIER